MSLRPTTWDRIKRVPFQRRIGWLGVATALVIGFAFLPTEANGAAQRSILHLYSKTAKAEICLIDPERRDRRCLTDNRRFDYDAVWSPDGSRVAWVQQTNEPRNPDIYVMDGTGRRKTRLTWSPRDDEAPRWSPDGTQIVWNRNRGDSPTGRLLVMSSDGSNKRRLVGGRDDAEARWSPDGEQILFLSRNECLAAGCASRQLDVHVVNANGAQERNLTQSAADEISAVWSPDGSHIAFVRAIQDGDSEIFVMEADGSGLAPITDTAGSALLPAWSPDGSHIAFTELTDPGNFETRLGVVEVATRDVRVLTDENVGGLQPTWALDASHLAFSGHRSLDNTASYEIHTIRPDGSELLRLTRTRGDEFELDWGGS